MLSYNIVFCLYFSKVLPIPGIAQLDQIFNCKRSIHLLRSSYPTPRDGLSVCLYTFYIDLSLQNHCADLNQNLLHVTMHALGWRQNTTKSTISQLQLHLTTPMQLKSIVNKLISVFLYTVYRFSLFKTIMPIQTKIGACYKACLGMKIIYSLIK